MRETRSAVRGARWALTAAAAIALSGVARPASAQEQATGFASDNYDPAERGSKWFTTESLDLRGQGRIALGATLDGSYRSVVHYRDGSVFRSIVRNQWFVHMGGAFTFYDRVRLAVSVPLQVAADGHTTTLNGRIYSPPSDQVAVGDTRMGVDVRLFGQPNDVLTAAVGGRVYVPSGAPNAYTGDGEPRFGPRFMLAGRYGMLAYSGRVGGTIRGRDEDFGDGRIGSSVDFGVAGGLLLLDDQLIVGPELWGGTVVSQGAAFEKSSTPVEVLLGAHLDVLGELRVGAAGGTGVARGIGVPVVRGLFSFEWVPGAPPPEAEAAGADRDGDGIPDDVDACPYAPGPKSEVEAENGCPIHDLDGDGIPDALDACPCVPGAHSVDIRINGCPPDRDGDGIPDPQDACPDEPGKANLDLSKNGCPERDRDGDGVLDGEDACPDEKGLRTTDPTTNGCPDPDRDKDGIPNDVDACPDDPGKADPDPKKNGCPKAFLKGSEIKIVDQVKFRTGSAVIDPGKDSAEVLEAVLAVVQAHPEIRKLRVEGHTDNVGAAAKNKALSQARATSVVAWLVKHGVAKDRLSAAGFGEEKPIADNTTEEGRRDNRRVELHVEEVAK